MWACPKYNLALGLEGFLTLTHHFVSPQDLHLLNGNRKTPGVFGARLEGLSFKGGVQVSGWEKEVLV